MKKKRYKQTEKDKMFRETLQAYKKWKEYTLHQIIERYQQMKNTIKWKGKPGIALSACKGAEISRSDLQQNHELANDNSLDHYIYRN